MSAQDLLQRGYADLVQVPDLSVFPKPTEVTATPTPTVDPSASPEVTPGPTETTQEDAAAAAAAAAATAVVAAVSAAAAGSAAASAASSTAGGASGGAAGGGAEKSGSSSAKSIKAKDSSSELDKQDKARNSEGIVDDRDDGIGDRLPIWASSALVLVDNPFVNLARRVSRISPILGKLFNDAGYARATAGSLSLALPLAAVALGIAGLQQIPSEIVPPPVWIFAAIVFIGALDALAGFIGMAVYCLGALLLGYIQTAGDFRLLSGLMMISFGPAMLATAARGLRRSRSVEFANWYERATDLLIAPVLAAWATKGLVELLDTLTHRQLTVAEHSGMIALVVGVGMVLRVIGEEVAAQWFPLRLSINNVEKFPSATARQKHISLALRIIFFAFLSASFLEIDWYLYVGVAFTSIPWIVSLYKKHYPNSPKLFQILPAGLPGLLFVLLIAGFVQSQMEQMNIDPELLGKLSFVVIPFFTGAISILGTFGREPHEGDVRWYMRESNRWIYRIGGVLVLLAWLHTIKFI